MDKAHCAEVQMYNKPHELQVYLDWCSHSEERPGILSQIRDIPTDNPAILLVGICLREILRRACKGIC